MSNRPTRKALCTIATGSHRDLLAISGPTFEAYAARHDYDLVVLERTLAPNRPVSWSKAVVPVFHGRRECLPPRS